MATFGSADDLYQTLRPVLARVEADAPDALQGLVAGRLLVRLKCTGPVAEVWLNGKARPFRASFGPGLQRPDLDVELAADTLHQLLLHTLSTKKAMANGLIRVKGPVWKLSALLDVIRAARRFYPAAEPH